MSFSLPATKLGQGYIFKGVCDSVHKGESASVHAGILHRPGQTPPTPLRQAPPRYTGKLQFNCRNTFLLPTTKLGQGYIFTGICDSVHGGGSASVHAGIPYPLERRHPWQDRHPPWQGDSPWQGDPSCAVHAGRYGQQAGGMHPTGMQFL